MEANYFTILYWFCHSSTWIRHRCTRVPHHLPPPSPYHPSGSSQCTSPEHPISWIEPGLAICFIYDIIHVSMPFSQIILSLPSPTESRRLFYTCVSLLLFHIQGYHYHPLQVIAEYWVEFLVLYSRFLLVIYFIYNSMYMSTPISQFVCPSIYLLAIKNMKYCHLQQHGWT